MGLKEGITLSEAHEDIKQMLLLISAFTQKNTQGEDLLNEWKEKYEDVPTYY